MSLLLLMVYSKLVSRASTLCIRSSPILCPTPNFISSSLNLSMSLPSLISTIAHDVARKCLLKMSGTSLSSCISKITKSTGKTKSPTFTSRFVRIGAPIPNLVNMEANIRLILAPKSASAFFTANSY
ncbi:hypothetical protein HanXRQr2_Chr05g0219401 [Helianthus annuus]|uniref:Uncharacterized protein n=2 Tax=Helianthus annuus TaxID=4232 RepID=A0A9K3NNH7_HELAN|nr:hypothetical protein HanXRQr2_Chr05g0219401 [Helianthus annuus]